MAKEGGGRGGVFYWRDPVEEAFVSAVWLLPLVSLVACLPPGLIPFLVSVAVVTAVEAVLARFTGKSVPLIGLSIAAFLGGLLGIGAAGIVWHLLSPHCPFGFWAYLLLAVLIAAISYLVVTPIYRLLQKFFGVLEVMA